MYWYHSSILVGMNSQSNASETMELLRNNFERHYKSNKAPFGIYFHAAWFVITENSGNFF